MNLDKPKFPIGIFEKPAEITDSIIQNWISDIEKLPEQLRHEVQHLSDEQLNTTYRPDGWTIRQVVHHCADSHLNSLIRFKLTLTETQPTVKPYYEDRWAELPDSKNMRVEPSLKIIEGIHQRWVVLLRSLTPTDYKRTFFHPEHGKTFNLEETLGTYSWHSRHHLAHITTLKAKKGWK
jgi:hypothetical protein